MSRGRLARRMGLGAFGTLALALAAVGPLLAAGYTASVADLTLAALGVSHTGQTSSGTLSLTASDTNLIPVGWNVTLQASALAYSGAHGTSPANDIPAANLTLGTPAAPVMTSGQAIDPTNGPKAVGSGGTLSAAIKVMNANFLFGKGTYTQQLPITLTVPANPRAGTYTATLTVTMVAGP